MTGKGDVGGIVGQITGYVKRCYTTGSVTGSSSKVGGIAGYLEASSSGYAIVEDYYALGNIKGTSYVGGIAGDVYGTINTRDTGIWRSCAMGNIESTNSTTSYTGGLIGALGLVIKQEKSKLNRGNKTY